MSNGFRLRIAPRLPRFQFTLKTLLALVTLVSVNLSVWTLHHGLGGIAAIAIFGSWCTAVAVSSHRYRIAYFLAAFTCGVLWHLAWMLPISPVGLIVLWWSPYLLSAKTTLCFCFASLAGATILRPWIIDHEGVPALLGLAFAGLTAVFFLFVFFIVLEDPGVFLLSGEAFLIGSLIVLVSFYVLLPAAIVILAIIRDVERTAIEMMRIEEDILEAVAVLEVLDRGTISCEEIAKQALHGRPVVRGFIDRLWRAGRLQRTDDGGYRLVRTE